MILNANTSLTLIDFVYGFRPILYFSRFCGMLSFSILFDSNGRPQRAKITKCYVLRLMISMCLHSMLFYLIIRNMKLSQHPNTAAYLLLLQNYQIRIVLLMFSIFMRVMDMMNRMKFVKLLKTYLLFDKQVSDWTFYENEISTIYERFFECRWKVLVFILTINKKIDGLGCSAPRY